MSGQSMAGHPAFQALIRAQVERIERGSWYHSIQLPDGTVIPGVIGIDALRARMDSFGVPEDLSGKRVLDVGAATGWCSFEAERRGAEVMAVDCVDFEDFRTARQLLQSKVEYRLLDVDELTPDTLGFFDYVFFFGVLYHLRHPLLGLERICALTKDTAYVESFVCDSHLAEPERAANGSYMEFYEADQLGGQIDNWVGPTTNCLMALCRSSGFATAELKHVLDRRAGVVCRRRWSLHGIRRPPLSRGSTPRSTTGPTTSSFIPAGTSISASISTRLNGAFRPTPCAWRWMATERPPCTSPNWGTMDGRRMFGCRRASRPDRIT